MALSDGDTRGGVGVGRSYYAGGGAGGGSAGGAGGGSGEKTCHHCKQAGHLIRNCPDLSQKKKGPIQKKKKARKPCAVKKFWCALHKGDTSKRCWSDNCSDLAQLDPTQRVKLMTDNGDCKHCLGDHKASDCPRQNRICGGRKDDRGCKRSHFLHEMFCVDAKVFASIRVMRVGNDSERVLLLIMKVLTARRGKEADVFFDLGSDENFVSEEHARQMGFKGKEDHLNVTTLGNVVTELTVMRYRCSLRDVGGKLEFFEAYGMETITGNVSQVGAERLKKFFPRLSVDQIQKLQRGTKVDFLIGMGHPSWHPERVEQSVGGGDFWRYEGKFGSCVGGRCPGLAEGTKKNQNLFTINHQSFHISSSTLTHQSHQLEFCSKRIEGYMDSCAVVETPVFFGPAVDVPTETDPTVDSPVVADPVPVADEPVGSVTVADPAVHVPAAANPAVDDAVPVEQSSSPAVYNVVVNSPAVEVVVNDPAADDAVVNDPAADDAVVNGPAVDDTDVNGPAVDDTVVNGPAVVPTVVDADV